MVWVSLLVVKPGNLVAYGPQLWRWPGLLFIVLVIVPSTSLGPGLVVLDPSGFRQPGIDYEDENEDD